MGIDLLTDVSAIGIGTSRQRPDATAKVRGEFEYAPISTRMGCCGARRCARLILMRAC